jgi:hypothetical protein
VWTKITCEEGEVMSEGDALVWSGRVVRVDLLPPAWFRVWDSENA